MTRIVLVHGIAQQVRGPESLLGDWYPALADGLKLALCTAPARDQVSMAFYGDLFRPAGHRGPGEPELDASDVQGGLEEDLLLQWWVTAAEWEPQVAGPGARTRLRTPHLIQRALDALSHSAFFAGLGERALIGSARQVRRYFADPEVRSAVQDRLARTVGQDTELIVAHSLGTVAAYEALCAHPEWPKLTLITLGSPLAVRNLVFDRLMPEPVGGHAEWPTPVKHWTNIADAGDVVALAKGLAPTFGGGIRDVLVHNGAKAHDVRPYLTAHETGSAVAEALHGGT